MWLARVHSANAAGNGVRVDLGSLDGFSVRDGNLLM
jgi:hypothetical protein